MCMSDDCRTCNGCYNPVVPIPNPLKEKPRLTITEPGWYVVSRTIIKGGYLGNGKDIPSAPEAVFVRRYRGPNRTEAELVAWFPGIEQETPVTDLAFVWSKLNLTDFTQGFFSAVTEGGAL